MIQSLSQTGLRSIRMPISEIITLNGEIAVSVLIILSIGLSYLNSKTNSLVVSVSNRWARWFCVSVGLAFLVNKFEWTDRPFWALAVIFFLFWLLLETLYTWLAISAMSQSSMPLFPRFRVNNSGEEWPAQQKLIDLRQWLRKNKFRKQQALVANLGYDLDIRSSVYQNEAGTIRAQLLFVPQGNGLIGHSISFTSETMDGDHYITDNLNTPYGGFYPDNWDVCRKPWTRSVGRLYKAHCKRIEGFDLQPFEIDPVDDINQQQGVLERTNIEAGFLVPHHLQEEMGRITWEGRYRVWKEVWLLNYFGVTSRG